MMQNHSFNSTDSQTLYVEQSSTELSPRRINAPEILNSTELSGASPIEHITLSSVVSPELQLITIHSDSDELSVWKTRPNRPMQLELLKLASQLIQYTCNHGGSLPDCSNA